jgi:hypothetical protein
MACVELVTEARPADCDRPVLRTGIRRTTHEVPVARARSPIGVVGPDARTSGKSSGMSAEDEGRSVAFEREKR